MWSQRPYVRACTPPIALDDAGDRSQLCGESDRLEMSALASSGAQRAQQDAIPPAVRALAADLLPRAPELARA
jgi:hypothetical protein